LKKVLLYLESPLPYRVARDFLGLLGERQKGGGSGTGDHRPTLCRTTCRINRLKGTVADLPQHSIFGPPTF
jgi:hypothetical protein